MAFEKDNDVSIPANLVEFVTGRVASGEFADAAQYVSSLIEADRRHRARVDLENLLIEGVCSESAREFGTEAWDEKRRALIERHGRR